MIIRLGLFALWAPFEVLQQFCFFFQRYLTNRRERSKLTRLVMIQQIVPFQEQRRPKKLRACTKWNGASPFRGSTDA